MRQWSWFKYVAAGLLVVAGGVGVWVWVTADDETADAATVADARQVKLAEVEHRTLERTVDVIGSLGAYDSATVSVKVGGRLHRLDVDLGDVVEVGNQLAQIEQRDYDLDVRQAEAQLAQARVRLGMDPDGGSDAPSADLASLNLVKRAQAELTEARRNLERTVPLSQRGISPQSELESLELAVEVAETRYEEALEEARHRMALLQERETQVEIARQRRSDTIIRAPFTGAVVQRIAGLGEYLNAGDPVVRLVRTDRLRLRVEVPERRAALVQKGQPLRFTVENETREHEATVTRLSPLIDEGRRVLQVEADVDNPGTLRPGAFARGRIVIKDDDPAITVPPDAIASFAGVDRAFIVADGEAVARTVTIGRRSDEWMEITDGLEPDDQVIRQPGAIQSGDPVRVVAADD